jgi:hypothetical protein
VPALSQSANAIKWLDQFGSPAESKVAASLLNEILLVNANELLRGLKQLLDEIKASQSGERPLALYAERRVPSREGRILPIFGEFGEVRATGDGFAPIPFDPAEPEVGSEGSVANLITSYQRYYHAAVLDHPGPDQLRSSKAGSIVIVTDFIGSGTRVCEMLEAFDLVRTIRSWHSYQLIKFHVVAYSGTERGIKLVLANRLAPNVLTIAGCPTINQAFRGKARDAVHDLCSSYPPSARYPLGFGEAGALIAFGHGVPDNTPAMLHHGEDGWKPLFPNRSSLATIEEFPSSNKAALARRASTTLRMHDAERRLSNPRGRNWIKTMLVLAAINAGARTPVRISVQTSLSIRSVAEILMLTRVALWTTIGHAITPLGCAELQRLRNRRLAKPILPTLRKPCYYPTQLRAR